MELSTFSSLLSFAIEMEERSARFYEEAADSGVCGHSNEAILALARQGRNRRSLHPRASVIGFKNTPNEYRPAPYATRPLKKQIPTMTVPHKRKLRSRVRSCC